jgi:serine/threonine-protein kinase
MGVVCEATHLRLEQPVAIKFLHPSLLDAEDAVARFEREARAAWRIQSPHVARVLDVGTTDDGIPYMVMEKLAGRDLEAELHARGSLPVSEAVDYVLQACAAVSAAHAAGVIHRDLKPANLFLHEENGRRVVKVLDFGISKMIDVGSSRTTGTCVTVGTPLYMSPEQVRSSRDVDPRTDVWSLGVILFEMLAGAPPFSGTTTAAIAAIVADATPSIRSIATGVPDDLERVIQKALSKAPEHRYQTVEELAAELVPFASEDGARGPYSYRPSRLPLARRAPRVGAYAGIIVAVMGLAAGVTLVFARTVLPAASANVAAKSRVTSTPPPARSITPLDLDAAPEVSGKPLAASDPATEPPTKRGDAEPPAIVAPAPRAPAPRAPSARPSSTNPGHARKHPLYL